MTVKRTLAIGVLAVAGAIAATYPSNDPDVFFHLAVGREIVLHGMPDKEPFCFPVEDRQFVNHEWLFDVALYAFTGGDGDYVVVFKALLSAALMVVSGLLAMELGASPIASALSGIAFIALFRPWLECRPHLAAYMIAAIFALVIRSRAIAFAPVLAALWANIHGSFPLAIPLLAIEAMRGSKPRRLILVSCLVILAFFVNPWGADIWPVVVHHANPIYRDLVPEWRGVSFGDLPAKDLLFIALTGLSLTSFLAEKNRKRIADLAMLLLFLVPALLAEKFLLGLAVSAVPVLAANLSRLRLRFGLFWGVAGACAGMMTVAGIPPGLKLDTGFDLEGYPKAAMSGQVAITGRLFNPFDIGGYVEFVAYPRLRPFIDGRAYVHGMEGIKSYIAALGDYQRFIALDNRWRFDAVLVDILDPSFPRLIGGLSNDERFVLAHLDSRFAVFTRAPGERPFEVLRATTDPRYLLELPDCQLEKARGEVTRVLANPEGEVLGLLLRGVLTLREAGVTPYDAAEGDPVLCARARDDFVRLVALRPDVGMFRYFEVLARFCAGDFAPWSRGHTH